MTFNHHIWPEYDIDLAMIEGTEIEAICGQRFVPTVTVGTSGRAHVPGAAMCEMCEEIKRLRREFGALERLRDQFQQQMDALNEEYRTLWIGTRRRADREREEISA